MSALHEVVDALHRNVHPNRLVWIKTDGYVTATLNPGDMPFAERFTKEWLVQYFYQEAMLNPAYIRESQDHFVSVFVAMGEPNNPLEFVAHLRARIRPGHMSALDWERVS